MGLVAHNLYEQIISLTVTPRFSWLTCPASRASGIFFVLVTEVTFVHQY
jgi:hypothetical protein